MRAHATQMAHENIDKAIKVADDILAQVVIVREVRERVLLVPFVLELNALHPQPVLCSACLIAGSLSACCCPRRVFSFIDSPIIFIYKGW